MKYRTGDAKKTKVYTHIMSLIIKKFLSTIKNIVTDTGIFKIDINPKYLQYIGFNTLFCLLINNLSSCLYCTPLIFTNKYGVKIKEQIKKLRAKTGIKLENRSTKDIPNVIPRKNIKFQKLSLFSLSLMNFILENITCSIRSSITYFGKIYQTILRIMGVCLGASALLLLSSAHVYALAQEANPKIVQKHLTVTLDIPGLISSIEKEYNIPKNLLRSIAMVESNFNLAALNIRGKSMIFSSKEEALEAMKSYLAEGVKNIDIGLMQINYHYHSKQFDQLEDMLDPVKNIKYAAELLCGLYDKHKTWHKAVRYYHSANRVHHDPYSKKVLVSWLGM